MRPNWAVKIGILGALLGPWVSGPGCRAAQDEAAEERSASRLATPETSPSIPPYRHPYTDGLYSTIVAMISVGAPEIKDLKKVKLKVPNFKKELAVRAILQPQKAPLVVVLVGIDGKADTPLGRLLPYWLNDAGYHVLTFDSTFVPSFADCSRSGVTGNIAQECEELGRVIGEYVNRPEVSKVVSRVGVVGYSLGGTQSLVLARMAAEKKLPFELSAALALSPPVKLKSTAQILDDFYKTDRWKFTMIDMGKTFMTHEPVAPGAKIPFEPEFMRAGIGYIIREEFTEIVDRNDEIFRLKQLPDEQKMEAGTNRREDARAWGFVRFMERMSFPYWKEKGTFKTIDDLWSGGDLTITMQNLPPYARAIVCEDDPFNAPEDLVELRRKADPKNLVVVPNGGHLGYLGTAWCYAHVMRMFRNP